MKIVILQIVWSVSFIHRIKIALHPSSIHDGVQADVASIFYHYELSISRAKFLAQHFFLLFFFYFVNTRQIRTQYQSTET
jgi:hypothetical protein